MEFTVEYYVSPAGRVPVREFLDELAESDPRARVAMDRGLHRLEERRFHKEPLCKALGNGLFELRHEGELNSRILWFYMVGRRIIVLHGIRHKAQAIPSQDLAVAKQRMMEFKRRDHA